jgi:hypothetical protein
VHVVDKELRFVRPTLLSFLASILPLLSGESGHPQRQKPGFQVNPGMKNNGGT